MQRNETRLLSYIVKKKKLTQNWLDLNTRPETIKILEENKDSKLPDMNLGDDFFGTNPKAKATKEIINK